MIKINGEVLFKDNPDMVVTFKKSEDEIAETKVEELNGLIGRYLHGEDSLKTMKQIEKEVGRETGEEVKALTYMQEIASLKISELLKERYNNFKPREITKEEEALSPTTKERQESVFEYIKGLKIEDLPQACMNYLVGQGQIETMNEYPKQDEPGVQVRIRNVEIVDKVMGLHIAELLVEKYGDGV